MFNGWIDQMVAGTLAAAGPLLTQLEDNHRMLRAVERLYNEGQISQENALSAYLMWAHYYNLPVIRIPWDKSEFAFSYAPATFHMIKPPAFQVEWDADKFFFGSGE